MQSVHCFTCVVYSPSHTTYKIIERICTGCSWLRASSCYLSPTPPAREEERTDSRGWRCRCLIHLLMGPCPPEPSSISPRGEGLPQASQLMYRLCAPGHSSHVEDGWARRRCSRPGTLANAGDQIRPAVVLFALVGAWSGRRSRLTDTHAEEAACTHAGEEKEAVARWCPHRGGGGGGSGVGNTGGGAGRWGRQRETTRKKGKERGRTWLTGAGRGRVCGRPSGYAWAGMRGVGDTNNSFLAETLFKLQFFYYVVLLPYPLQKHITGGSDINDKVGPF
jgi:hypothetical protein